VLEEKNAHQGRRACRGKRRRAQGVLVELHRPGKAEKFMMHRQLAPIAIAQEKNGFAEKLSANGLQLTTTPPPFLQPAHQIEVSVSQHTGHSALSAGSSGGEGDRPGGRITLFGTRTGPLHAFCWPAPTSRAAKTRRESRQAFHARPGVAPPKGAPFAFSRPSGSSVPFFPQGKLRTPPALAVRGSHGQ